MTPWNIHSILPLMLEAGRRASSHPRRRQPERKSDASWVTPADKENEEFLRDGLKILGAGFIGEESLEKSSGEDHMHGFHFVIDPIDGTAPYTNGLPTWGISIGLMHDGEFLDGALYLPEAGTLLWTEGPNAFAHLNIPLHGASASFRESSFALDPLETAPEYGMVAISQIIAKNGSYSGRRYVQAAASSVWALAQLALGRSVGYISRGSLWDFAGALPILVRLGFRGGLHGSGLKSLRHADELFLGYPSLGARSHIIVAPFEDLVLEIERDSFLG